jgi:hypothetical protein
MPTDPTSIPPDSDPNPQAPPDTPPGEVLPFEAQWGFDATYDLTDVQLRAIELTVQGLTDSHIAQVLNVNRKTIWKWKTYNEEYKSALTAARLQAHCTVVDRFRSLLMQSSSILAKALQDPVEEKRYRAALALLNMAGCFRPLPIELVRPDPNNDDDFPMPELPPKVG